MREVNYVLLKKSALHCATRYELWEEQFMRTNMHFLYSYSMLMFVEIILKNRKKNSYNEETEVESNIEYF